jgi:hypothetical protein
MLYIYILELESNKYYIGKTTNPEFRLDKHFDGSASVWTSKYKPIKLIELISNCDNFDEDKYTLKYMEKYGIDNVRGGSFCQIILNQENLNTINKMIKNSLNKNFSDSENIDYDEYLKKFNNIEEINSEIKILEQEFEYIKNLNNIFKNINDNWKNFILDHEKQINQINKLRQNIRLKYKFILQLGFENASLIDPNDLKFNQNNIDKIFDDYSFFVDNVKNNNLSTDILKYIKNDDITANIFTVFYGIIKNSCYDNIQITKSNFSELISNKYIDLDIFEKINLYNNKVKVKKLCLFLIQIENEVKRIYKNHQVENIELYEFGVNKKIEILTDKMIIFTEENSEL